MEHDAEQRTVNFQAAAVVPIISAKVSRLIFGITFSDLLSLPKWANSKSVRASRFSAELKS